MPAVLDLWHQYLSPMRSGRCLVRQRHCGRLRNTAAVLDREVFQQPVRIAINPHGSATSPLVSIAAVFRHFPSKDALLAEVAADGFDRLVAKWDKRLPSLRTAGAEARFRRVGETYIEFALASPALYRLMFVHGDMRRFSTLQQVAERCFGYVLAAAADTVREAGAAEKWVLPAANAAWSLVHGYVMLSLCGRLTEAGGKPHLASSMVSRFLQLPKDALDKP